jgi:thioredoxin 1
MSSMTQNALQLTQVRPVDNDQIQTVTTGTFNAQVLKARGPVAVEFMSYSCSFCGNLEPALQEAARRLASKVKVCRVNIASEPGLAERYGITGTPTLLMFKGGDELDRVEGMDPELVGLMATLAGPFGSLA